MYRRYFKRLLDILLSIIAVVILSPIFLIIIIFVKLKLGSQVIFKQQRAGFNEKVFTLYKFRTMTSERDIYGNLLPDDKRLTKFGRFLRSTSLDELPQLFNIIRGDMSIIGPRPLLVDYLSLYNDWQRRRHSVRPGLFGLASIKGRNAQSWEDKFRHDIEYIDNLSFKLDCKIFFKAFYIVIKREGVDEAESVTATPFYGTKDNIAENDTDEKGMVNIS